MAVLFVILLHLNQALIFFKPELFGPISDPCISFLFFVISYPKERTSGLDHNIGHEVSTQKVF